jgi:hypothetical protein
MSKRTRLLLAASLLIGMALMFYQLNSANSATASLSPYARESQDLLRPPADSPVIAQVVPTLASAASHEAIAEEIKLLNDKWAARFLQNANWIHFVTKHDRTKDQIGPLPNGQPIPMDYIMESWWQLNEQRLVVAGVSLMRNETGDVVQVSTFRDGMWRNLTFPDQPPTFGEPFAPILDFGLYDEVLRSKAWGSQVSRSETIAANSQDHWITFVIHTLSAEPRTIAGYAKAVIGGQWRAAFDPESGQLLWFERVTLMADGEQRVTEHVEFMTLERVSAPPQEVLEFLKAGGNQ